MSDLPSRGAASSWLHDPDRAVASSPVFDVLEARASGELMTAAEWRDTIDYEAGLAYLLKIWVLVYGDEPSQQVRAILWDGIQGGVDAAIGDTG